MRLGGDFKINSNINDSGFPVKYIDKHVHLSIHTESKVEFERPKVR